MQKLHSYGKGNWPPGPPISAAYIVCKTTSVVTAQENQLEGSYIKILICKTPSKWYYNIYLKLLRYTEIEYLPTVLIITYADRVL